MDTSATAGHVHKQCQMCIRDSLDGVRTRLFAQLGYELVAGLEDVLPAKEDLWCDGKVLADLLAARGHDAVHEDGGGAQLVEGVNECLRHEFIVLGVLRRLARVAPALVRGAEELVAHAEGVVQLEGCLLYTSQDKVLGAPEGFRITVRELKVSAGAHFVVALTGNVLTMPGLPKVPAAENIDVDDNGVISGLF